MTPALTRELVFKLAAEAQLDARTVERAARDGVSKLRAAVDRERLTAAAKRLGVKLPP